jgi:hypothetical protein
MQELGLEEGLRKLKCRIWLLLPRGLLVFWSMIVAQKKEGAAVVNIDVVQ